MPNMDISLADLATINHNSLIRGQYRLKEPFVEVINHATNKQIGLAVVKGVGDGGLKSPNIDGYNLKFENQDKWTNEYRIHAREFALTSVYPYEVGTAQQRLRELDLWLSDNPGQALNVNMINSMRILRKTGEFQRIAYDIMTLPLVGTATDSKTGRRLLIV